MTVKQIKEFNVEKPSIALRQAIEDLEQVEASDKVDVDMSSYHRKYSDPGYEYDCAVCFAGAVMLNRFESDTPMSCPSQCLLLKGGGKKLVSALLGMDYIRAYQYSNFLAGFMVEVVDREALELDFLRDIRKVPYEQDAVEFKDNMRLIADICEKHGY